MMSMVYVAAALSLGLVAGACGGDATSDLCPAGTTEHERAESFRLTRWCLDAAGLAHGPYRVEQQRDDRPIFDDDGDDLGTSRLPALVEGAFGHGEPDGVWRWRFPYHQTADPLTVQYQQEYTAGGLAHGTWHEATDTGQRVAEQRFDHGRRCDTWRTWQGDSVTSEVAYTPCADLPPFDPPDPTPTDPPEWDGASCPAGERVTAERDGATEVWCEVAGVRAGPYRYEDATALVVGHYAAGARDGRWRLWLEGQVLTDATYRAGLLEGPWRRWHPSGALAEDGAYLGDLATGPWTRYWPSGAERERGAYEAGHQHGVWQRLAANGAVIETVTWQHGRRHGAYDARYDDGAPECVGAYADDLRTGSWTCYHLNGATLHTGDYVAGLRDGRWQGFEPDGRPLFDGAYAAGSPVGTWTYWLDSTLDGQRLAQSGGHRDGARDGAWETRWVDDDALAATLVYAADTLHGPLRSWYRDGQDFQRGDYVAGEQHGRWLTWYPNGQQELDVGFFHGYRHGPWTEWWPNGQKRRESVYENDIEQPGASAWDEQGDPVPTQGEG